MNRIKELRIKKGITQTRLASELGASQQTLSRIENDKTILSCDLAINAAHYFYVTIDYLLGESKYRYSREILHRLEFLIPDYNILISDFISLTTESQNLIRKLIHIISQQEAKKNIKSIKIKIEVQNTALQKSEQEFTVYTSNQMPT